MVAILFRGRGVKHSELVGLKSQHILLKSKYLLHYFHPKLVYDSMRARQPSNEGGAYRFLIMLISGKLSDLYKQMVRQVHGVKIEGIENSQYIEWQKVTCSVNNICHHCFNP